ncbi:outer membrane protein assembly factor BamB family protein [Paractinoplanes atraurantiacus]|uniref:Outer membrane protein assembly factor BamB n=1 Tax=Paractinoplanes atraurantiacus TaxID=1036182 RepID=A0A285FJB1_9ACTN|nr:PQQ-binding-like beta-propeller repeat protein [Actinoplanes atraurantiacus]SNY10341.1 outer membrane protein assembly factor BamB [Actinoplanes atraurantiacus]
MATIELGEISGRRPEQRRPLGRDRRIAGAAVALLGLFVVAGSAVPGPHGVRPLWSVPAAGSQGMALTAETVYLHRADGLGSLISAYDLATGHIRWQRPLSGSVGYVQAAEEAGLLLIPAEAGRGGYRTIALSTATGDEVWRASGEPRTIGGDTALMADYTADGGLRQMRLVRLAGNSTLWQRDTPGVRNQIVAMSGDRPDSVVTATAGGEVRVYAYGTGALTAAGRIPMVDPRPEEGYFNDLVAFGGHLVVNRSRAGVFELSVYRLDTLRELWHAADTDGYAFSCGPSLCLSGAGGVVAHDPATGRVRWRLPGATNALTVGDGRLVLDDGSEEGEPVLVDAATGEPVGAPGRGSPVWSPDPGDSVLLLRSTVSPPGRTAVTRWELDTGRHVLLGTIERMPGYHCQSAARFLTCARGDVIEVSEVP